MNQTLVVHLNKELVVMAMVMDRNGFVMYTESVIWQGSERQKIQTIQDVLCTR